MNLSIYLILFLVPFLAGLLFLFIKKTNPIYLKLSLAFSGAYLFSLTILHLIPEVYSTGMNTVGMYILAGFLLQIIIEFFSEGIEHGHIHVHHKMDRNFPLAVMLGLCLHSFFEGMPVSMRLDSAASRNLISGIVLHHIPVSFALMSLLVASGVSRYKSVIFMILFCLMTPAGAFIGNQISVSLENTQGFINNFMGIVIGIFLHISTTILFESGDEHRFNLYKIGMILAGVAVSLLIL